MSTVKVSNIQKTGESVSRDVSGVAAAWCTYDQASSPVVIMQSLNISSVSDNSSGNARYSLSSGMSDTNFPVTTACTSSASNQQIRQDQDQVGSYVQGCRNSSVTAADTSSASTLHGDLA